MASKTLNFLPDIFRTDPNRKFLSATAEQLISEPNFKRVNGYIGRRLAPTFKASDNYILENTQDRQNYQLEPCVVVEDPYTNKINFFSSYRDLLQKISYYGGHVTNHDRLFSNEYYTFDGCFDFDKFINFNNYYWVANGPDAVDVYAGSVDSEGTYQINRNAIDGGYNFSSKGNETNPILTLARGGTYQFEVTQPGKKFWIQSEPGVLGTKATQPSVSTRDVLGVINNGVDSGVVTFRVPLITAQERYTSMELVASVDLATDISYSDIQNHSLKEFVKSHPIGIDGYTTATDLDGRYIVFVNNDIDDEFWTDNEIYDVYPYDVVVAETVPMDQRRNLWRIQMIPSGTDHVIKLIPSTEVASNQRVFVRRGQYNATKEYFIDYDGLYHQVPNITASADRLYYQDGSDANFVGEMRIVDSNNVFIDVESDILSRKNYTSPNGVIFTNGLKIRFDSQVTPARYRQKEYYVEGVGKSIRLIDVDNLVNPGYFDQALENLDYVTINRGSLDLNAWSRSNRWFHIDVLKATAKYNNTVELPDNTYRANRPIIEFEADLQMFDFGRVGLNPVDFLDFYVTDAFSQVEGAGNPYDSLTGYNKDDVVVVGSKIYRAVINLQQIPSVTDNWEMVGAAENYDPTRVYFANSLARYQDGIYRARIVTAEHEPTDPNYWTPVAYLRDSFVEFDIGEAYDQGALVVYQDQYYICVSPGGSAGITPDLSTALWSTVDVYVDYDSTVANSILEGQYALYQRVLYRAVMDIAQPPSESNQYWQEILSVVDGKTVIFAGDADPEVRNRVYQMNMETIDGREVAHLTPLSTDTIQKNNTVVIQDGLNLGKNYWYDGADWREATAKTAVNQKPMFEVVDNNGYSFGDTDRYSNTTFSGTSIFSYRSGTGKNDPVLGFPLKYRNFSNVGDIEFSNDFDNSSFSYLADTKETSKKINLGYLLSYSDLDNAQTKNIWVKVQEKSRQYQVISHVFDGSTNYFEIDIEPEEETSDIPYTKVYVNNVLLKKSQYVYDRIGARKCIRIASSVLSDRASVDILIYSKQKSELGYYEVPLNLDFNALNTDFGYLTLGQIKNHMSKLSENTNDYVSSSGVYSGYRDIIYKTHGGSILQHASPTVYSSLFLQDKEVNFVDSVDLAAKEYLKFKNKFLEIAANNVVDDLSQIPAAVDSILKSINLVKTSQFPWYYSDMVPYGDNRREYIDTVINPELRQFDLPTVFNDKELSNRAVLVYVNDRQLTKDTDYYFPQDRTAVIINDSYDLNADDMVKIVDYFDTDGSYVPETPSKIGLYPKFKPGVLRDDTYRNPIDVLQGHDGSLTPCFGDYRDDLLLELELRIYNNIKVDYKENIVNIHDHVPGRFRDTGYTLTEFNRTISKSFLRWAGTNQVDFSSNSTFVANDPWTWNYQGYQDRIDGSTLPGTWRAIYKHYFDTDRPNTHPWEMLGFSEEPNWWQDRYGEAPYTGGNLLLWEDLSQGYIHSGARAGYDARFARPQLLDIIPVDQYGALRSPFDFLIKNFNSQDASRSFSVGAFGPAEAAWRRSSDYPFALQKAIALMKPAFYFGSLINVMRYNRSDKLDQIINKDTLRRITPESIVVQGTNNADGTVDRVAGYLNWIRDFVLSLGREPSVVIRNKINNLSVRLGYQVAGYTDKNYIKILAEQSSPMSTNDSVVLPEENYFVHLAKSSPIRKVVYSGVVVEKSNNGFIVSGYDLSNPYFTIIPSLANNNAYAVTVGQQRGVIYRDYQSKKITVPYGYEFTTRQQVVDFLISYGRYLTGQGCRFVDTDTDLKAKKDWVLSVKEFLHWSQQGWGPGNLIILSPVGSSLRVSTPTGVIDHVTNTINGSKLLDQQFSTIKSNQFTVVRQDNEFKVTALSGQMICLAELEVVQYEHSLVFDNVTVFNDIVYMPESGNRQYRLKLIGSKTSDWTGELDPPGFIYNNEQVDAWEPGRDYKKGSIVEFKEQYFTALENVVAASEFDRTVWTLIDKSSIKTGLLPNFAYNSQKFENIYDIDNNAADFDLLEYSAGLIGFRERDYLTDFGLETASQIKFYQGFIKDKGTKNSIDALTTAQLNNVSSSIDVYEEWAIRVGEYGAVDSDSQIEVVLDESLFTNESNTIEFLDINETASVNAIGVKINDVYRKTTDYRKDIFFNRTDNTDTSGDILTAGFVNLADVDATVFDIKEQADLDQFLPEAGRGFKIWVAKDFDSEWDVYRVTETENSVESVRYDLDDNLSVTFDRSHDLVDGDVFVIKGLNPVIDGFYRVSAVLDSRRVTTTIYKNSEKIKQTRTFSGTGVFLKTESMRVSKPTDISTLTPALGWLVGDRVWVDQNDREDRWAVYEKTRPWDYQQRIQAQTSESIGSDQFGYALKINSQRDLVVVSSPGSSEGNIKTFVKLISGEYKQSATFKPTQLVDVTGFGKAVDLKSYTTAVGAPDTWSGQGLVYVYNFRGDNESYSPQIILNPNAQSGDLFGYSVNVSDDGQWLFVGSPGAAKVFAYRKETNVVSSKSILPFTGIGQYEIDFDISESLLPLIQVSSKDQILILGTEYNIIGDSESGYQVDIIDDSRIVGAIDIKLAPGYVLAETISNSDAGSEFGYSVRTNRDGSKLFVGAPDSDLEDFVRDIEGNIKLDENGDPTPFTYSNAGKVYFYRRVVEEQTTKTSQILYVTKFIDNITTVKIDSQVLDPRSDYTVDSEKVVLASPVESGRRLEFGSSTFLLDQIITSPDFVESNRFGKTIDIDGPAAALYVGAPNYHDSSYYQGKVYRFADRGINFGQISSLESLTSLAAGSIVMVNRTPVALTESGSGAATLDTLVSDLQSAAIPGINVETTQGTFTITDVSRRKVGIDIYDVTGTTLSDLGITTYTLVQEIIEPNDNDGSFGSLVKVSDDGNTLLVSSTNANILQEVIIDSAETQFDNDTTKFMHTVEGSGAVYMFEMLTDADTGINNAGSMVYAESLTLDDVYAGDQFGHSVDVQQDVIMVSSPGYDALPTAGTYDFTVENLKELSFIDTRAFSNDTKILVLSDSQEQGRWSIWKIVGKQLTKIDSANIENIGSIHFYKNTSGTRCWNLDSIQEPRVDLYSVNKLSIYSRVDNTVLAHLDFIDPAKGKILGVAEQDLDFKTELDPAIYTNATADLQVDSDMRWGEPQIGMIWWNLSKVRYLDYEQGDLTYRTANWSSMFPGSTVEICEWVSSPVPPSQYVANGGSGQPLYDGQAFVVDTVVDSRSGIVNPRYYFWVTGKTNVTASNKKNSPAALKSIIEQPALQGIPYAGVIKSNSLALFGVNRYLSDTDVVLQIDYANIPNNNGIHTEFELVQENRRESEIPSTILDKMIDSLAGIDRIGNVVPDPRLSDSEKTGISFRPRQSMFQNRSKALKAVVDYINRTFASLPVINQFNINGLLAQDPVPGPAAHDIKVATVDELNYINTDEISVGYRVLIESDSTNDGLWTIWRFNGTVFELSRVQVYKTNLYWDYQDWYAESFDPSVEIKHVVDYDKDVAKLSLTSGDIIKVRYSQTGNFSIYRVTDDLSIETVGLEKGTIQFSSALYDLGSNGMGFDATNFDIIRYDRTPGIEIRAVLNSIRDMIFVGEFRDYFNKMFFVAINYLLSEQKYNDWIFKTSFINVVHRLRKLEQYPSYVRDNQDYYIDYINEVKPYRTQIREYLLNYNGQEQFSGDVTDFDLPPYYDKKLNQYRTPNGEKSTDQTLLAGVDYRNWNAQHTFVVDSITVENGGEDYTIIPEITIVGGGGTGARARAQINYNQIIAIEVIDAGSGYTSTPTVIINGNGVGAKAYVNLRNVADSNGGYNLVRSVDTTIKLDRVAYESNIQPWVANAGTGSTPVIYADRVYYENKVYRYNEKNVFAVPVVMSAIETFLISLQDTFEVTNTTLYTTTIVRRNGQQIGYNRDYTIDGQYLTILNPRDGDVIGVKYLDESLIEQYETFEISPVRSYQLAKTPRNFASTGTSYQVYVGDILRVEGQHYTLSGKDVTFLVQPDSSNDIVAGQQVKVYVDSNTVSTVDPDTLPGASYDQDTGQWSIDVAGETIYIDDLSSVSAGQKVMGSGINNFDNQVFVDVVDVNNNEIRLISNEKQRREQGHWIGETWVPGELITYRDPAVLVLGRDVVELLFFVTPISTGNVFDYRSFTMVPGDQVGNAIDRAMSYYTPTEGGTGQDPAQIIKGINYPGVLVQGLPFSQDEALSSVASLIDSHISSRYQDIALGTRPEDITVDGGKYIDRFSSHAPEELVPGIVFDSLNMQVYTKPIEPWTETFTVEDNATEYRLLDHATSAQDVNVVLDGRVLSINQDFVLISDGEVIRLLSEPENDVTVTISGFSVIGAPLGYRIFHGISEEHDYYRIAEAFSTFLTNDLLLTDTEISVEDVTKLSKPTSKNPGRVFINGEMITYLEIDEANNKIKRIRRGVNGTGAAALHVAGARVVDSGNLQMLPGNADTGRWMNSGREFGFKEIGDFDLYNFDADQNGIVPQDSASSPTGVVTGVQGARFDSLATVNSTDVVPTEQARFLSKSPSFSP